MQNYRVELESVIPKTYRTQKAVDSVNLDVMKKSRHVLEVEADLTSPYNVGLIVGASGSGKTTLARQIFGEDCTRDVLVGETPVIEQFPKGMKYDACVEALTGVGLTSIPCWVRPAHTLSNGQRARAEAALKTATGSDVVVLDEWTSTVDRTIAQIMCAKISKQYRKGARRIVLLSCHYDVIPWLQPDWIIDCNTGSYEKKKSTGGSRLNLPSENVQAALGGILASIII